jgi:hypothetical protein
MSDVEHLSVAAHSPALTPTMTSEQVRKDDKARNSGMRNKIRNQVDSAHANFISNPYQTVLGQVPVVGAPMSSAVTAVNKHHLKGDLSALANAAQHNSPVKRDLQARSRSAGASRNRAVASGAVSVVGSVVGNMVGGPLGEVATGVLGEGASSAIQAVTGRGMDDLAGDAVGAGVEHLGDTVASKVFSTSDGDEVRRRFRGQKEHPMKPGEHDAARRLARSLRKEDLALAKGEVVPFRKPVPQHALRRAGALLDGNVASQAWMDPHSKTQQARGLKMLKNRSGKGSIPGSGDLKLEDI